MTQSRLLSIGVNAILEEDNIMTVFRLLQVLTCETQLEGILAKKKRREVKLDDRKK